MDDPRDASGAVFLSLATLVVGAAIGAATALLLVSKPGQSPRLPAFVTADGWRERAAEALAQGRERVVSAVERGQGGGFGGADSAPDVGAVRPA